VDEVRNYRNKDREVCQGIFEDIAGSEIRIVHVQLAARIGLNEAIFLSQLDYWLQRSGRLYFGVKWIYNSGPQWRIQFPFFSLITVRRIANSLKKRGLIKIRYFGKDMDYERLKEVMAGPEKGMEEGKFDENLL